MKQYDRRRRLLAIAIAALAGLVDANGFLAANRYFLSFMSGNTTRLAVDIVKDPHQALVPLGLVGGFVAGVTIGAIIADRALARRKTAILAFATILLLVAAVAHGAGVLGLMMGATVVAMGSLNNSFRRNGEVAVGLTYMTGALVRFGQGLAARLQGQHSAGTFNNLALWMAMLGGAVGGAALFVALPLAGTWACAGYAAILAIAAWRLERSAA